MKGALAGWISVNCLATNDEWINVEPSGENEVRRTGIKQS
jgi:hypothetical protein